MTTMEKNNERFVNKQVNGMDALSYSSLRQIVKDTYLSFPSLS